MVNNKTEKMVQLQVVVVVLEEKEEEEEEDKGQWVAGLAQVAGKKYAKDVQMEIAV